MESTVTEMDEKELKLDCKEKLFPKNFDQTDFSDKPLAEGTS